MTMRVKSWGGVIAIEGTATIDNRMVSHAALTWDELPIPLVSPLHMRIFGTVHVIERRDDGIIYAAGEYFRPWVWTGAMIPVGITLGDAMTTRHGNLLVVTAGRIVDVSIVRRSAWPQTKIRIGSGLPQTLR